MVMTSKQIVQFSEASGVTVIDIADVADGSPGSLLGDISIEIGAAA